MVPLSVVKWATNIALNFDHFLLRAIRKICCKKPTSICPKNDLSKRGFVQKRICPIKDLSNAGVATNWLAKNIRKNYGNTLLLKMNIFTHYFIDYLCFSKNLFFCEISFKKCIFLEKSLFTESMRIKFEGNFAKKRDFC